jgi:hypothetical protein
MSEGKIWVVTTMSCLSSDGALHAVPHQICPVLSCPVLCCAVLCCAVPRQASAGCLVFPLRYFRP